MNVKASIPDPCSESWDTMKIGVHSRFCDSCRKNVMDFTTKSRGEILEYLLTNYNKQVCGRIRPSQLDFSHSDLLITIRALTKHHRDSNLSFYLLAAGTLMLTGCTPAPSGKQPEIVPKTEVIVPTIPASDSTGQQCALPEKEKTDSLPERIEITEQNFIMGDIMVVLPEPPPSVTTKDDFLVGFVAMDPTFSERGNSIYRYPEVMPEFAGGIDSLMSYIQGNLHYPKWEQKKKIKGTVYVEFIIDKTGKVRNPVIIESVPGSKNFDSEVIRVIENMPRWIPGKNNGKAVDTEFRLPVKFQLQKN